MKVEGSLGCSDHETVEFKILRGMIKINSRITTLDFRRAGFGLFRDQLGRIPQEVALEGKGTQESRLISKDKLLRAQERSICNV